jgi:hypothetical protein
LAHPGGILRSIVSAVILWYLWCFWCCVGAVIGGSTSPLRNKTLRREPRKQGKGLEAAILAASSPVWFFHGFSIDA